MGHRTTEERLLAKIQLEASGCWVWSGSTHPSGYATIRHNGRSQYIHRVSYELWREPIPEGLEIDHLCKVRNCVNPDHLEPVTHAENVARGDYSGPRPGARGHRKTHCPQGHEYTPDNVYTYPSQGRHCRKCTIARSLARYYEKKDAS